MELLLRNVTEARVSHGHIDLSQNPTPLRKLVFAQISRCLRISCLAYLELKEKNSVE